MYSTWYSSVHISGGVLCTPGIVSVPNSAITIGFPNRVCSSSNSRASASAQIIPCVVEQVVPTARQCDRARRRQRLEPSRCLALFFSIELEVPQARQV